MISYYAEQAMQHAARNPHDPAAQAQAVHWVGMLQQQRQAQLQLQQLAAARAQAPGGTAPESLPQQPPGQVPMFGAQQAPMQAATNMHNPFAVGTLFGPQMSQVPRM